MPYYQTLYQTSIMRWAIFFSITEVCTVVLVFYHQGVTAPFGWLVDFPLPQFGGLRGCIHRSCVPKLEPRARWLDLPCPIWKKQSSTLTGVPIFLNWKMWLYVSFRNIGWFERRHLWDASNQQCVFTIQFSISGKMSPFFRSWGNAGKRSPFFGALFGRWIFVACQTSGSNASAVLHDPPVAIKPECIALVCHSSRVGACGCCALGGLVPIFFLGVVFFLWRFGCGDVGRFIFLWEKKGYIPRRFIFHEKNVNIFRNWKDSNLLLQAPWGLFLGECWEDFSPRKWWNWKCTNLSFHGVSGFFPKESAGGRKKLRHRPGLVWMEPLV